MNSAHIRAARLRQFRKNVSNEKNARIPSPFRRSITNLNKFRRKARYTHVAMQSQITYSTHAKILDTFFFFFFASRNVVFWVLRAKKKEVSRAREVIREDFHH